MNTNETKLKRGRPVGSTSFTTVTLEELNKKFQSSDKIVVGKLWFEGRDGPKIVDPVVLLAVEPAETPKVEMTLVP
jgi:hypothetical protein